MKHFYKLLVLIFCINQISDSFGQYPIFNPNQYSNYILNNPGLTGAEECPHFGLNYIFQDNKNPDFHTIAACFASPVDILAGGIGLNIIGDWSNQSYKYYKIEGIYSYHLNFSPKLVFKPTLSINYSNSSFDFSSLSNRYDFGTNSNSFNNGIYQKGYFSFGSGLLMYSKNFFSGFYFENLNTPVEAIVFNSKFELPIKFSLIAGSNIKIRKSILNPVLVYQSQKGRLPIPIGAIEKYMINDTRYIGANINLIKPKLNYGLGYRYIFNNYPSYHAQVGYKLPNLQFNYNLGVSPYKSISGSTNSTFFHQFSFDYTIRCYRRTSGKYNPIVWSPRYMTNYRKLYCPSFSTNFPSNYSTNDQSIKSGTLTAGEINDFKKWELWQDVTKEELSEHQKTWQIKPEKRYSVMVINEDGKPVVDVDVTMLSSEDDVIWKAKTDNTGKAELWSNLYSNDEIAAYFEVNKDGNISKFRDAKEFHDGINILKINAECEVSSQVDILFVVDATGSMSDEINYLKEELQDIILQTKEQNPSLNINLGSLFYRCLDNSYVTKKSKFSNDINQTIEFIKEQESGEGGIEAVEVALEESVNDFSWSEKANARLLFIILDEPPGNDNNIVKKMNKAITQAAEKGIRIIPLVASGTSYTIDKSLEYLMRSCALATNGTYAFLTDHSGVGNTHTLPTTDEYDVEYMNKLILRLIHQFSKVSSCQENFEDQLNEISDTTYVEIIEHVVLDSAQIEQRVEERAKIELELTNPDTLGNSVDTFTFQNNFIEVKKSFKFYPNPTTGIVLIEMEGEINELYLTDINGKLMERYETQNIDKIQIDISKYPNGFYLLQYESNNKWFGGKIFLTK